jgi:hypothetical protein
VGESVIDVLLRSDEPSVRWRVRTQLLGEDEQAPRNRRLRQEVRRSPRVQRLLGAVGEPPDVYAKWHGAHWVLSALADLGHPPGDPSLYPMRDRVLDRWLGPQYFREFTASGKAASYRGNGGVPVLDGRHRRCASQQGNALRYLTVLGLADGRTERLVERLRYWQWPDGGWNCDRNPTAAVSSFCETLLPMRGLAAYAGVTGDGAAGDAARRAAEVFLSRRLAFRRSTGELIRAELTQLHYPLYWHYDVLGGLVGMAEAGTLADPRCADALDLLAAKRLPDGGWPAEKRYYRVSARPGNGVDLVDWGGTSVRQTNEWVTVDALVVLSRAGRVSV